MKRRPHKHSSGTRALSVLLLVAFLFSQGASYIAFKTQQFVIKEKAEEQIRMGVSDRDLISFDASHIMNSADFSWEEWGTEFFYKGKMYDLVKTKVVDGKRVFKCLDDKHEMQLIATYQKLIEKSSKSNSNNHNNAGFSFFLYDVNPDFVFSLSNRKTLSITHLIDPKISAGHSSILAPPPIG